MLFPLESERERELCYLNAKFKVYLPSLRMFGDRYMFAAAAAMLAGFIWAAVDWVCVCENGFVMIGLEVAGSIEETVDGLGLLSSEGVEADTWGAKLLVFELLLLLFSKLFKFAPLFMPRSCWCCCANLLASRPESSSALKGFGGAGESLLLLLLLLLPPVFAATCDNAAEKSMLCCCWLAPPPLFAASD